MSICQLQKKSISLLISIFSLIYLIGCAETPVEPIKPTEKKLITADWFKLPPRFTSIEKDETVSVHPFFDIAWKAEDYDDWGNGKSFKLPYFVTTPIDSEAQYEFDMYSGKIYRERMFCPQDDVWRNYTSNLERPNFTQGIIPRVYNELQKPQQVILFSSENFKPYFEKSIKSYADVKVIGSVILETCEVYPCDIKERWKSSQILVGVPYEDTGFGKIENFMNLKSKIDWTYAKAMLGNMEGNHFLGGRYAPSRRILKELGKAESRDYFNKKANLMGEKGLAEGKAWRDSCFKLYDTLWDESEKIRASKSDQSQKFFTYFQDFYNKNSAELFRCQTLVRPANILDNTRRFWFFSFIQAFTLLEKSNVTYSCREKTWLVHSKIEFGRCRANTFEKSFEQAINGLRLMKTQMNQQYHFVEYDSLTGGSHQALYSWIFEGQRNYGCKNGTSAVDISNTDIFPQDVEWESFEQGDARVVR